MIKFQKTKNTLFLAILMTFVVAFTSIAYATNVISVTRYEDSDFTWRSAPELKNLTIQCDSISLYAECEGDEIDELTVHIEGREHPEVSKSFDFYADGSVETIAVSLPPDIYKVYFTGSDNIKKNWALLVFTVVE